MGAVHVPVLLYAGAADVFGLLCLPALMAVALVFLFFFLRGSGGATCLRDIALGAEQPTLPQQPGSCLQGARGRSWSRGRLRSTGRA